MLQTVKTLGRSFQTLLYIFLYLFQCLLDSFGELRLNIMYLRTIRFPSCWEFKRVYHHIVPNSNTNCIALAIYRLPPFNFEVPSTATNPGRWRNIWQFLITGKGIKGGLKGACPIKSLGVRVTSSQTRYHYRCVSQQWFPRRRKMGSSMVSYVDRENAITLSFIPI